MPGEGTLTVASSHWLREEMMSSARGQARPCSSRRGTRGVQGSNTMRGGATAEVSNMRGFKKKNEEKEVPKSKGTLLLEWQTA